MSDRKYSVADVQRMRGAVRWMNQPQPMQAYSQTDLDNRVEAQLQTYLVAGVCPDELEKTAGGRLG